MLGLHVFNLRVPGGWIGVDLFFALSGFLITTLLVEEAGDRGGVDLKAFYGRRARRLLPALGVFVVFMLVSGLVDPGRRAELAWAVGGAATYTTDILVMSGVHVAYDHLWSLSVEEQFYVVWPLVIGALLSRSGVRAWRWPLAVALAFIVLFPLLTAVGVDGRVLYFGPIAHLQPLMLGCVAGILFATGRLPTTASWWRPALGAAGAVSLGWVLLVAALWWSGDPVTLHGGFAVTAVACATLVLAAVDGVPGPLAAVWKLWPLQELGRISYSLYIWHGAAVSLIPPSSPGTALAATAVAVVMAELSYRLVERPVLNRKRRPALVPDVAPEAVPHTLPAVASASDIIR